MDAAMVDMVAGPQPGRGWDGGGGGRADTMLGLAGACALLSACYLEAFDPYGDLILLEASDDLLPDLLQGRVTVRGCPGEEAVLCMPLVTYMKFVGTSNSMFMIPPGEAVAPSLRPDHTNEDASVASDVAALSIKVAPGSIELARTAPRLDNEGTLSGRGHMCLMRILEMASDIRSDCTRGKISVCSSWWMG